MEKILDFLTPGDWGESYSSRLVNPNFESAGYPVRCMQDIINAIQCFLYADKEYFNLFRSLELYLDGHLIGQLRSDGGLCIYAPSETKRTENDVIIRYPYGDKNLYANINDKNLRFTRR